MNVITFRFGKKLNDWVNTLPEKTIWMLKAENMVSAYITDSSGVFLFIQWGAVHGQQSPFSGASISLFFICGPILSSITVKTQRSKNEPFLSIAIHSNSSHGL